VAWWIGVSAYGPFRGPGLERAVWGSGLRGGTLTRKAYTKATEGKGPFLVPEVLRFRYVLDF